jgi:endonuclease/exonuclease/phosphatase family metal-dependent hydrolase
MDFFYDGGKGVRDSEENVLNNFNRIAGFLEANDSIDFILLQEVDRSSKRSYRTNQFSDLEELLIDHLGFLGMNYSTGFVPVPINAPLGKVKSGIATYSDMKPSVVIRYGFEGNYSWPKRLFLLKRCFLVCSFPVANGKQFNLVNIHNSAYDDGTLRAEQLSVLSNFAIREFKKGNYVLFGGDWNQSPNGFKPLFDQPFDTLNLSYLSDDFMKDWQRIYCDTVPSNRRIKAPYTKGKTFTTVIDYYIVSPNITLLQYKTHDLNFENSDHQPLIISFSLND